MGVTFFNNLEEVKIYQIARSDTAQVVLWKVIWWVVIVKSKSM